MFRVGIGNNYIEGNSTTRLLVVDDSELFKVEIRKGRWLASLNIYDSTGKHVARLRRDAWAFNDAALTVTTQADSLVLKDGEKMLAEVVKPEQGFIWLRRADLYSQSGLRLLIGDENNFDLEVQEKGTSLARFSACRFLNPASVIDVADTGDPVLTGNGARVSRQHPGLRVESSTFEA
jgi:hypothetical protein